MNTVQKTILVCGLLVFCFISIYPPYQQTILTEHGAVKIPVGRHYIFFTPQPDPPGTGLGVDVPRAVLQSAALAAFTAGYIVLASGKKK